jgi:hypothetical protein
MIVPHCTACHVPPRAVGTAKPFKGSQRDNPARLLIECCLKLVRGSSRANRAAEEALEAPAETGEDVHVGRG